MEIRTLTASEIECRIGSQDKTNAQPQWCTLLLYKDARCDYRMLDELFGQFGWQCSYETINGKLFCTIKIWDEEKGQWIAKQNVGTESNTEATKGEASDALKRAAFAVGIGRELYSAPTIFIRLSPSEVSGKIVKTRFNVTDISYDANRQIDGLKIVDNRGEVRYAMGKFAAAPIRDEAVDNELNTAIAQIAKAKTTKQLASIYNAYPSLQGNGNFVSALTQRKKEIAA